MVFGFEPGTLLVKGDSSDRGSIPGTIAYEAKFAPTVTVLKAMDPGFKPGRIPVANLSLSVRTESYGFTQGLEPNSPTGFGNELRKQHFPLSSPEMRASLASYGCSGSSAGLSTSPGIQAGIRYSLTGKVLRLGLKPKDPSFKKGGIRPGFPTGIHIHRFEGRPRNGNGAIIVEIDRIVIRDVQYKFEVIRCRNEEVNFQGSSAYSVGGDSGQNGQTDRRTDGRRR
ncbi:hypothetical protein DPMN_055541 [Dreissena polymorpha]|uniref:Uncharacterized protein n=1 Tax=Dreissena polymorpha TaxID=45954 RepID=A0A9D4CQ59_DREPO|nr:hypothetical protein DPMN_055541 [Dreissena polymorpha]